MKLRISWQKKLADAKDLPKVVKIEGKMSRRWGTGTCAIPAPMEVDELMRKVPKGKLTTINDIRSAVARKHRATIGCPITCGIFAFIAANAAEEARIRRICIVTKPAIRIRIILTHRISTTKATAKSMVTHKREMADNFTFRGTPFFSR